MNATFSLTVLLCTAGISFLASAEVTMAGEGPDARRNLDGYYWTPVGFMHTGDNQIYRWTASGWVRSGDGQLVSNTPPRAVVQQPQQPQQAQEARDKYAEQPYGDKAPPQTVVAEIKRQQDADNAQKQAEAQKQADAQKQGAPASPPNPQKLGKQVADKVDYYDQTYRDGMKMIDERFPWVGGNAQRLEARLAFHQHWMENKAMIEAARAMARRGGRREVQ